MSNSTKPRSGTETFRPKARLISILGEQLIRDATIGLLELIKNGYDADADEVSVKLQNIKNQDGISQEEALKKVTVIVEDDGIGMDLDTVIGKWLEPATGYRELEKTQDIRTPKGRLPLGEKGVGRFATHKIGRHLELISRHRNTEGELGSTEVRVEVNWDLFDDHDEYLSNVPVDFEERTPEYFTAHSGTLIKMTHARYAWKENDIKKISAAMRRMMSPFRTPASFKINLFCPDYPKYENLDPSELLDSAHANISAIVDENGVATYEYSFKLKPYKARKKSPTEVDLRKNNEHWGQVERKPTCGGFFINFYLWDRNRNSLGLSETNPKELDKSNGVSVFRDGIRVMPYGDPEDDWLNIDADRYMRTSEAISRKNVVGNVEITQTENPNLKDKSNREGFIENEAFNDFKSLMDSFLALVHKEFSFDRKLIREAEKVKKQEMVPALDQLEATVEKVRMSLDDALGLVDELMKKGKISSEIGEDFSELLNSSRIALVSAAIDTRQAASDALVDLDEQREMLLNLAGLGLAAERFTHEFARLTNESRLLIRTVAASTEVGKNPKVEKKVRALETAIDSLHDLVRALGPMFYIRTKTKIDTYRIKSIIDSALLPGFNYQVQQRMND